MREGRQAVPLADAFEAAIQKVYLKTRGRINVPGFRKGKAPRKIIEGMYGSGVFYEDAINDVYRQCPWQSRRTIPAQNEKNPPGHQNAVDVFLETI